MKRFGILFALLCLLAAPCAHGLGQDEVVRQQLGQLDTDALEKAAPDALEDVALDAGISFQDGVAALLGQGKEAAQTALRAGLRATVSLLLVAVLCSVAGSMQGELGISSLEPVEIAGAAAIMGLAASDIRQMIGLGGQLIANLSEFSNVLLPTFTAAVSTSGMAGAATARQLATMLFSDVLITVIDRLLKPLLYAYLAASAAYAAVGNNGLSSMARFLKWFIGGTLTTIMIVYVGYLSMCGVMGGSADTVAVRAASMAVSAFPVVGGILSDATATVFAGAQLVRNAIGVFGVLAIVSFCIVPVLNLLIQYLLYKAASILADTVCSGRIGGLIANIGTAFGLVLGMVGSSALLLLISIFTSITGVTSL